VVEGLALVLVLKDITLSTRTQITTLGVCAGLRADARWRAFVKILAKGWVCWVDDFASGAGAEWADRCLDAAIGAGSGVTTIAVTFCKVNEGNVKMYNKSIIQMTNLKK
jgi:hypothetical protein